MMNFLLVRLCNFESIPISFLFMILFIQTGSTGFFGFSISLFPEERVKGHPAFPETINLLEKAMILFAFLQERQKNILLIPGLDLAVFIA